ncbi:ER-retained PMA1-suppressing protein 1 [Trichomonascus vanleenenianus]|uniref:protein disulfide isomerase EPS1 n=1 Tax=Trichomonascus vanleenenianus TaxID=2268995 RepID=UPI003ECAF054
MKLLWVLMGWLAVVASAAPVEQGPPRGPPELADAEFDSTVANGTWFIKFYSPYCPHCKEFAPTWVELFKEMEEDAKKKSFHFASVNCVEQGDLCDRLEIETYPNLQLFSKGKMVGTFQERKRTVERLKAYVSQNYGLAAAPEKDVKATQVQKFPEFPASTDKVNSVYPSPPKPTYEVDMSKPNPQGESKDLDLTTFGRIVTASHDPWLVKFYSPRCPHCISVAPAWAEMAKATRNYINVGEINCDVERQLCKDAGIEQIPTIMYVSGTSRSLYNGLRGYADLMTYAKSAVESRNPPEVDAKSIFGIVSDSNIGGPRSSKTSANFVYLYDDATVSEDFEALEQVSIRLLGNAHVYKSKDKKLIEKLGAKSLPALFAVFEEDRWLEYPALAPKEVRDYGDMADWAQETWLSLVPQLTPANAKEVFAHAKYLALALIDPRDVNAHALAMKEMKATAYSFLDHRMKQYNEELASLRAKKQLVVDEAKERGDEGGAERASRKRVEVPKMPTVGFAWIDQVFWERWIKSRYGHDSLRTKPRVIINDEKGGRFWDVNARGNYIDASRTQLLDMLEQVVENQTSLRPKALHNSIAGYFVHVRNWIVSYWHLMVIAALVAVLYVTNRRQIRLGIRNGTSVFYQPVQLDKFD